MSNTNVAFYVGGLTRETLDNSASVTATYWLPAASDDWELNPVLGTAIEVGAAFIDTDTLGLKVWDGSSWRFDLDTDKTIQAQWTFEQMPLVENGAGTYSILPPGGVAGQVLSKVDGDNYNTAWVDPSAGTFDPNFNYNITGSWTFQSDVTASILLEQTDGDPGERKGSLSVSGGNIALQIRDDAGAFIESGLTIFRDPTQVTTVKASVEGQTVLDLQSRAEGSILFYDKRDAINRVSPGLRRRTSYINESAVTLDQNDEFTGITFSGETVGSIITLPVLEQGTLISIYNISNTQSQTINAGSSLTLSWFPDSGPRVQGSNFTLAPGGSVEVWWSTGTTAYMTGKQVS